MSADKYAGIGWRPRPDDNHYAWVGEVDGILVRSTQQLDWEEARAYVARGKDLWNGLMAVNVDIDGDEAVIGYDLKERPIERIRRITGYLVGTLDRFNDAKREEESLRVKHSTTRPVEGKNHD